MLNDDVNERVDQRQVGARSNRQVEIRLELRGDFANEDIFAKGTEAKGNQMTGLAAFLAYF